MVHDRLGSRSAYCTIVEKSWMLEVIASRRCGHSSWNLGRDETS